MSDNDQRQRRALVIGAGPVGSLTALSLHKRGWEVEVWDTRDGEFEFRSVGAARFGEALYDANTPRAFLYTISDGLLKDSANPQTPEAAT